MSYDSERNLYIGYIYKIENDINNKVYIGQTISTIAERWHGHMSAALNEKRCKSALYNAMRKYGREKFHIHEIINVSHATKDGLINELNRLEKYYILQYQSLTSQNGYNVEVGGDNKKVAGRKVNKYDTDLNYICSYESCEEAGRQNDIDGCTVYGCCKHQYYTAGGYVWAFDGEEPVKPHYKQRCEYNYKEKPKSQKTKREYKSKKLPKDVIHHNKLLRVGYFGKIIQYNSFKEVINVFEDIIYASEKLNTQPQIILNNRLSLNITQKELAEAFNKSIEVKGVSVKNVNKAKNKKTVYAFFGDNYLSSFSKKLPLLVITSTADDVVGDQALKLKDFLTFNQYNFEFYNEENPSCGHVFNVTKPWQDSAKKCNNYLIKFIKKHQK